MRNLTAWDGLFGTVRLLPTAAEIAGHATAIKDSAARAVDAILERRAQMDRAGHQNKILAVAAGELHYAPAHHIHHMAVLDGLSREANVAVGYEFMHNVLPGFFTILRQEVATDAALAHLRERDRNGDLSLKACLSIYEGNYADQARAALFRFLLNRQIPARFTDTAMIDGEIVDAGDASTAESLQACFRRVIKGISVVSPDAMHARNHHMAKLGIAHAHAIGANVLFHQCGVSHVIGDTSHGYKGEHSLSAHFRTLGASIMAMPVLARIFTKACVPRDTGLNKQERLFVSNLPTIRAIYDFPDRPLEGEPAELQSRTEEAIYVSALLEQLGYENEIAMPDADERQRNAFQEKIIQIIKDCPNPAAPLPAP